MLSMSVFINGKKQKLSAILVLILYRFQVPKAEPDIGDTKILRDPSPKRL